MPISPLDPHANRLESPGYSALGTNGNYTRKILDRAGAGLGEAHSTIAAVKRITRTTQEVGLDQPSSERRVFTLEGITQGLGLDSADEQRVQRLVEDTSASFDSKSYPKLVQAISKITMALRRSWHIPSATRTEIARRARSYYQNTQTTDYGVKKPSIRYSPYGTEEKTPEQPMRKASPRLVIPLAKAAPAMDKPPPGFMPVPKSRKGGWKSPDGKMYWYPDGKGVRGAAEEGGEVGQGSAPGQEGPQGQGSAPGAAGGAKGPKQGAPPPKAGKGAPGAPGGAGKGAAGGRHEAAHKFAFAAAPEGSDHDATELHHRAELTKVKHLLKQAREAGDQEAVQKLMAIGKQHQDAGNAAIRAGAEAFAQGGPSQGEQGQQPPEQEPEQAEADAGAQEQQGTQQTPAPAQASAGSSPMAADDEGDALPGEEELASDPRKGLERTSTGVTKDANGNRQTAANSKPRLVPEAKIVGEMRERLGRAVNVMSDLSAAHDDLATQKQNLAKWKASGHPAAKQAVATIRAQMAATQADISQLEAAHAEAMKDVSESQNAMREAKIRESPIFQAFMGVMGKIGTAAGTAKEAVGAKVGEIKEGIETEKKNASLREQTKQALEAGGGIPLPESNKPTSARDRQKRVAIDLNPQVSQAEAALRRLAAQDDEPDLEEVDADLLADDEEEISADERMAREAMKRPAKISDDSAYRAEREKDARQKEIIDKLESEGRFGGPEQSIGGPDESGVREKGESPIERKKRMLEERKRASEQDAKGTVKVKRPAAAMAKSRQRRRVVPMDEIVKNEAWAIAIDLGMQAKNELRKSYAGPQLVVLTKSAARVPYFFNEL